jgi:two-component sensor histidine kinase
VEVPAGVEPLAQSVLAEGLRNAHKHAKPSSVRVRVGRLDGAFVVEVRNDGAQASSPRGAGMGLRLAAVEALQRGALVEFGPDGGDWRLRLVVPLEDDSPDEP